MTRALAGTLMLGFLLGCSREPPVAQLDEQGTLAYASAVNALLPSFAQSAEAANGFCLGLRVQGSAAPLDPAANLLARFDTHAAPLFPYSECEPRPAPGWGDVRHAPTGKMVGVLVLGPLTWSADGAAQVSVRVDGGPFAAAGFVCTVQPGAPASCSMSWIS